jgi:hypothetical protein
MSPEVPLSRAAPAHANEARFQPRGPSGIFWVPLILFGALVAALVASFVLGILPSPGPAWPFFPFVWPLGFFIVVVSAVVLLRWTWWASRGWAGGYPGEWMGADELLRLRYARGEIDRDQFVAMREALEEGR